MRNKSGRLVISEILFYFSERQSEKSKCRHRIDEVDIILEQSNFPGELKLWVAVRSSALTSSLRRKIIC